MTKNEHQEILTKLHPDLTIIERFTGGMSNFTYKVENKKTKKLFVFRIIAPGGENFVNYKTEKLNLEIIKHLNLNSEVIYFNENNGIKLSTYIDGQMIFENVDYKKIASTLKILHTSNVALASNYNHLDRLSDYELLHSNHVDEYIGLKTKFIKIYDKYLVQHITNPCHNDAQIANFILSTTGEYKLLDWEFAGVNDPLYDVASFGNKNFDDAVNLLQVYLDNPTKNDYLRIYAWRMFQCLQWFNVASKKHEDGLSEKLKIPFDKVSDMYINLAKTMYDKVLESI